MKFADMNPPPWETTVVYGRADLRLHPLIKEAYKVACLIEDCGGSPELTLASSAAFSLTEQISDYFKSHANDDKVRQILRNLDEVIRAASIEIQPMLKGPGGQLIGGRS